MRGVSESGGGAKYTVHAGRKEFSMADGMGLER